MVALRTGIVVVTLAIKTMCRVLTVHRVQINQVIAAAVAGNVITSAQSLILGTWLDGAQGACDIIRAVSGY